MEAQKTSKLAYLSLVENYIDGVLRFNKKGDLIYVEGHLQTRSWDDKEEKRHFMTEVLTEKLTMLSSRKKNNDSKTPIAVAEGEEDVPF